MYVCYPSVYNNIEGQMQVECVEYSVYEFISAWIMTVEATVLSDFCIFSSASWV